MRFLKTSGLLPGLFFFMLILVVLFSKRPAATFSKLHTAVSTLWEAPDIDTLPATHEGNQIRYGHDLLVRTAYYLGRKGRVAHLTNGMNCQNCHLNGGTQNFGNPFSAVASTFPKYRPRSGRIESIEFRINDCLMRSLNGKSLDSLSPEMRAMVAYLKWVGKDVPKGVKPTGSGLDPLPFLPRAADPAKGRLVFAQKCQRCHGDNGQGVFTKDSVAFIYPPLWGKNSYNTAAGMYRLFQLATFVKYNMPFGTTFSEPQLSNAEAWDVAAFVNSQPRPQKVYTNDWPELAKKPVDYPFGPYADTFSERQHKYGPFAPIAKAKGNK